jgi:outer membrane protein OmpA-like peptidoglycan-associated protein/tetratricopeptide (TPR) repeat protein
MMRATYKLLMILVLLLVGLAAQAQKSKKAEQLYQKKGYQASLDEYKNGQGKLGKDGKAKKTSVTQMSQMANSYRLTGDYANAAVWYGQLVKRSDKAEYLINYAQCLQAIGDCDKAIVYASRFDSLAIADGLENEKAKDTRGEELVRGCKMAGNVRTVENVTVTNAGFNSDKLDFSPVFYDNGVVFVSNRKHPSRLTTKRTDIWTKDYFNDLWFAPFDGASFGEAKPFSTKINSEFHEGSASFNKGGDKIYFTRNLYYKGKKMKNKKGMTRLGIFMAELIDGTWQNLQAFEYNNIDRAHCHPTISADGKYLVYAADRVGGRGGMDLYISEFEDGTWSKPVSLGANVNTAGNELFPFMHSDGTLYFASNGHAGVGGLDIFYSKQVSMGDSTFWSVPVNIGKPFNTTADDFGFVLDEAGKKGLFTSARAGGKGSDDIYVFDAPNGLKAKEPIIIESNIFVFDEESYQRIPQADVEVTVLAADAAAGGNADEDYVIVLKPYGDEADGLYQVSVKRKDGSDASAEEEAELFETNDNGSFSMRMEPNRKYVFKASKTGYSDAVAEYSTAGIKRSEKVEYGIPMKAPKPKAKAVGISGYVLNGSYDNYKIANATVTLLNMCNGDETVISSDENGAFFFPLECGCDFVLKGEKKNFNGDTKDIKLRGIECPKDGVQQNLVFNTGKISTVTPGDLKEGYVMELNRVFYDFDKFDIREDARPDLDKVVEFMKTYSSMVVELGSHTDSRGSSVYNTKLSAKRAQAAADYIVSKGIERNRIYTRGYGEDNPRNECKDGVDCNEAAHQYNRRTEVKVLSLDIPQVEIKYNDNLPVRIDKKSGE